jgi:predicted naringenin-chalcone synthase
MSFITSIGTAVPPNRFSQATIADFMIQAMQLEPAESRKLKTIFRSSGIVYRHSVLDDYGKKDKFLFYANTPDLEPFPSTAQRLHQYQQNALPLTIQAIQNCFQQSEHASINNATHLIVVSCTGMYAPGLDIELIKELKLPGNIQRTCITFMGCYAAINAIKIADAICKSDSQAKVLVVCIEMCSIHFQKEPTLDNMLANALFADGAAALLVEPRPQPGINLETQVFHNGLSSNGEEHMAWSIGNLGFEMKLSSYVPDIIQSGIGTLTKTLLDKLDLTLSAINYFAIHPGGKKILQAIEQELGLTVEQNKPAYSVLQQFGNMSSPTVLFVMKSIVQQLRENDHNKLILSFAFGPGLTMESMLLKIHIE